MRLVNQRDTARAELHRSTSTDTCGGGARPAGSLSHSRSVPSLPPVAPAPAPAAPPPRVAAVLQEPNAAAAAAPPAPGQLPPGMTFEGLSQLSSRRTAELYAAAASDGQLAARVMQYETALDSERRKAHQAIAACHASQVRGHLPPISPDPSTPDLAACHASQRRATESEEKLRLMQSQLYVVSSQVRCHLPPISLRSPSDLPLLLPHRGLVAARLARRLAR